MTHFERLMSLVDDTLMLPVLYDTGIVWRGTFQGAFRNLRIDPTRTCWDVVMVLVCERNVIESARWLETTVVVVPDKYLVCKVVAFDCPGGQMFYNSCNHRWLKKAIEYSLCKHVDE